MSSRKALLLALLLAVGMPIVAEAQQCEWCDRLAVYIKAYKYKRIPKDKVPVEQQPVADVEGVKFMIPETLPVSREMVDGTPAARDFEEAQGENDHVYWVCPYHKRLEHALAFGRGDADKFEDPPAEGVKFSAEPLAETVSDTEAFYSLVGDPSSPTVYVVEVAHGGYSKATVDVKVSDGKGGLADASDHGPWETQFRETNQATFRVLKMDPVSGGQPQQIMAPSPISGLGEEIDVNDGGTVFRLKLERTRVPSEEAGVGGEALRKQRIDNHRFEKGASWIVRLGYDPLQRVIPRSEPYAKVKGASDPNKVKELMAEAFAEYLDILLAEYKALDDKRAMYKDKESYTDAEWQTYQNLRAEMAVIASEIEEANIHSTELESIVFCDYNKSAPAVRIWTDYTDHRMPQGMALSPWKGAFQKYEEESMWDYLIPYLTIIGVLLVSSVLSIFGIKSAGG